MRIGFLALGLLAAACSGASPTGQAPGSSTASSQAVSPIPAASSPTASAQGTPAVAGAAADPCVLVTRAEAEAQAGGSVTVESGALPGPTGEGAFCRYTGGGQEVMVRTAVGRGDFDNDRRFATGNDQGVTDEPGLGDEAWTDRGQALSSVNVIASGQWLRISMYSGKDSVEALLKLAALAVPRLSAP